jgi:hypothetical protein
MMRNRVLSFVFVIACSACAIAQSGKVERIGALTDAKPEIVSAVEDQGYRATVGDAPVAEIWPAKNAPDASSANPKTGNTSAVYPQFAKGQFVGVVRFVSPAKDFRGQEIKPGTYTMRYDLLPADGNHMGAAAQPDFVLLVPLDQDFDPSKAMPERVLINLGKRTSGTSHPATFSMVPPDLPKEAAKEYPAVFKNSDGFDVFAAKMNVGGKETAVAIVLRGQAAQ